MSTAILAPGSRGRRLSKRLLQVVITLFGLLLLTFTIGRVMPIDPVLAIVGPDADQSTYQQVYQQLGFDKSLTTQFGIYFVNLLHGDLGNALLTGKPVVDDIIRVFPATMELATMAIIVGAGLGIPLGVLAAARRNSVSDYVVRIISLAGYSTPIFWVGMMGLLVFYAWLGWVGGAGRVDLGLDGVVPRRTGLMTVDALLAGNGQVFWNAINHLILPASLLGFHSLAYISRMTRSFMLAQLSQEFIITARVKGLTERQVIWNHAFRNILVQLLTVVALAYGALLEGAVLIETVFSWPGFGSYLTGSLLLGDMNAVMGCVLLVVAIFAPLIAPYNPLVQDLNSALVAPNAQHWFGTDEFGRDIFSRLVYGSRITLYIVLLVSVTVGPLGLLLGVSAGYFGGKVDMVLMRVTDIFISFPSLVLALAFVAALGPGLEHVVIAITLTAWPPIARLARAETLSLRQADFISAVRLQGASSARVLWRHIVPLCLPSVIIRITMNMAGIILTAAGLGFLGLGAQPPEPEWGAMISSGRTYMMECWWVVTIPGLAILINSLAFNFLGDGLRDILDPRSE
ncbi:TPA: ABC transporter permease subunit [Klebsiella pneumoniae]|nr:ABC transporter permease subunit [Klebsiella pneumoniae]HBQ8422696.1 ABC transporter permease subunit [Klebsiella pneumoniae]HEN3943103.1 ABC transporter permease subunit [Klebsiella pneumoniae]